MFRFLLCTLSVFLPSSDFFFLFVLEVTWEDQQKKVNGTINDDKPLPKKKQQSETGLSGFGKPLKAWDDKHCISCFLNRCVLFVPHFSHFGVNFVVYRSYLYYSGEHFISSLFSKLVLRIWKKNNYFIIKATYLGKQLDY